MTDQPVSPDVLVRQLNELTANQNDRDTCVVKAWVLRAAASCIEALEERQHKCAHVDDVLMLEREARQQAEALAKHYQEREEHFASVLKVCDGGRYRNDWDASIRAVLADRDAAEARAKRREEERDAKERARLAQMEADRTGKTTSFIGSDGYRYIVDPQPEVMALRDALRRLVEAVDKAHVVGVGSVQDTVMLSGGAWDRICREFFAARSLLNAEKSEHP